MEVLTQYKNLSDEAKLDVEKYIIEKTKAIAKLLTKFADDAVILKINVEKFEKHDAFEVELNLSLPSKIMVSKEASHNIEKAVDQSKARLIDQIKKHISKLRHDSDKGSIRA